MGTGRRGFRAVFMRGGTSKALIFRGADLPRDAAERDAFFLRVMGSPDPGGRQLDGMGGGVSSLSKICIVDRSERADADVDYTFAQVPVKGTRVDYSANCGNMSSAIGPYAVEEGLVPAEGCEAVVRIHNTNTGKIIVSRFALAGGLPAIEGDFVNPGVAGTGAPIRLDFLEPGGAITGALLPTGRAVDLLEHPDLPRPVPASTVDAANCGVFVPAAALGLDGTETPDAMEADAALMRRLELLRRLASVRAGIAESLEAAGAVEGNPKIALVAPLRDHTQATGARLAAADHAVSVRMISMAQAHRAIPLTGAVCTAVAARIAGTTVAEAARVPASPDAPLLIGHSSGVLPAVADVAAEPGGAWRARSAGVFRTARRLMEGTVYG